MAAFLKVSGHQVGQIGGFCAKASDIQKFVTLRILHRFFQDLKSEKFGPLGVRPCQQKFLPLLDRRNFWTFRIFSKFFSEKSIFQDFDVRFFQRRGCGGSEISFWRDPSRLGLKPHGRPKSRTGPPRWVTNISSCVMILMLVHSRYLKNINCKRFIEFPR